MREVREETAIRAEILGLVDVNDVIIRNNAGILRAHYLLTIFVGQWLAGEPTAGDDCLEARFVDVDRVGAFETTDRLEHFIRLAHERWMISGR